MTRADWATLLTDAAGLREHGCFIAEGRLVLQRVLDSLGAGQIVEALATPAAVRALGLDELIGDRLVTRTPAEMAGLTGFNFHRGVLALVRRLPVSGPRQLIADAGGGARSEEGGAGAARPRRLIVVAEHLADVDNVGSCFRNARAFGAVAVLLDDRCPDPLYRKAVRTSLGAVLDVPWTSAPMPALLDALAECDVHTIGLTPHSATEAGCPVGPLSTVCAVIPPAARVAIVVGNEGAGLSGETMARCTSLARIPMAGDADSVNVATALAVALYELRR